MDTTHLRINLLLVALLGAACLGGLLLAVEVEHQDKVITAAASFLGALGAVLRDLLKPDRASDK